MKVIIKAVSFFISQMIELIEPRSWPFSLNNNISIEGFRQRWSLIGFSTRCFKCVDGWMKGVGERGGNGGNGNVMIESPSNAIECYQLCCISY